MKVMSSSLDIHPARRYTNPSVFSFPNCSTTKIRAFGANTGEILWRQRTNSGITGVPVTYTLDGKQYVAVQSGWGVDAQREQNLLNMVKGENHYVPQGGVIWVFALPD